MNTLTDQIAAAAIARQEAAFEEYRKLVARAESPRKGDAEAMQSLMAELGIDAQQLGRDIGIVYRERELAGQAADLPRLQEALQAAQKEHDALHAEFQNIEATFRTRLGVTLGACRLAESLARPVGAAAKKLAALRTEHWKLLGAEDPSAAAKRRHLVQVVLQRPTGAPFEVIEFESLMANPKGGWNLDSTEIIPLGDQTADGLAALVSRARAIIRDGRDCRYMTSDDIERFARKDMATCPTSDPGFPIDSIRWECLPGQTQEELGSLLAKTRKMQQKEDRRRRDIDRYGPDAMRNLQRVEAIAAQ